jgi:hypothetical protein
LNCKELAQIGKTALSSVLNALLIAVILSGFHPEVLLKRPYSLLVVV